MKNKLSNYSTLINYLFFLFLSSISISLYFASCGTDNGNTAPKDGIINENTGNDNNFDVPFPPDGYETIQPDVPPARTGSISGVVYSPESGNPMIPNFPVSGALVFVTQTPPPEIPQGVYCNKCVTIEETIPHAFTEANGSFRIDNITEGSWILVVQKGEFRKVSYINVVADQNITIDRANTTFPRFHAPPNDFTPRMAIALGSYDIMEDIVSKMGLCGLNSDYHWDEQQCDHIDMYDNGGAGWGVNVPPFSDLLRDLNRMLQYHIIFVPCSNSTTDSELRNPAVLENIRQYVSAGGKWYIADWSYDFVEQAFPDFLDFEGDDRQIGAADDASWEFDTTGRAVDTDLRNWLIAIGEPADGINFEENWDCIAAVGNVPAFDEDGNPINIIPYTWAEGPIEREHNCIGGNAPLTLTFPYGCGKVLFTTYHTVGAMGGISRPNLITQEKILFYLILEIGLCTQGVVVI